MASRRARVIRVDKDFADLLDGIKSRHKEAFGVELNNPQITQGLARSLKENPFINGSSDKDIGGIFR